MSWAGRLRLKCDGPRAENRFGLSAKRTSPFKSARRGRQFSRLLAAELCASAVVMLDTPCSEVVWWVLTAHSIRQFPLHFPSRASPLRISGSNVGYTMFRGNVKNTGYPLQSPVSPSLLLPCVTVCHHISAGVLPIVGHLVAKLQQTSGQSKYTDLGHSSLVINSSASNTTTSRVEERVRGFSVMFQISIYSE